ncbi:MAG TPA: hypothetical protein VHM66_08360, partial [Solirubrobacterales bacterium]|nr:hypothetical protein [Solirubrobacterales bacterium]
MATLKPIPRPDGALRSQTGAPSLAAEPAAQVKELERTPRERRGIYVKLPLKLALVIVIALAWAGFSFWLSLPWIDTLGQSITLPVAVAV